MTRHISVTLIAMLAVGAACAPGEEPVESEGTPVDPETVPAESASNLPAAAVLIAHRVGDYDAWKPVFDGHAQARKDASCLGHYLKRGVDFPNMVYVYCLATDADKLRAFLDSADLDETMSNAGVEGEPEITVMKPMSRDLVAKQRLPGIIVMHSVEDYDKWRLVYDEFDEFRRTSGIVGHAAPLASILPQPATELMQGSAAEFEVLLHQIAEEPSWNADENRGHGGGGGGRVGPTIEGRQAAEGIPVTHHAEPAHAAVRTKMGDPDPTGDHDKHQIGAFALLEKDGVPLSPDLSSLGSDVIKNRNRERTEWKNLVKWRSRRVPLRDAP